MDPKIKKVKLSEIQPDLANANRHTERGTAMVSNSIQEHGYIDAGTLDKNNRIANGNSRTEIASGQGADEAYVVEFEKRGGTPVYLKYNDLDLETEEGRRAAYALNRTAQLSIDWNPEQVAADLQAGLNLDGLFQDWELEYLGGVEAGDIDPEAEWVGMPEYNQEDQAPVRSLIVHFLTDEDAEAFSKLIGQKFSDKTRFIYFPEQKRKELLGLRYESSES